MKKRVLVISSGLVHPSIKARGCLKTALRGNGEFDFDFKTGIEKLEKLAGGDYSSVIIYLHRKNMSIQAFEALKDFVSAGGGLIGLHSATASFKDNEEYFNILGGKFVSHEEVIEFSVKPEHGTDEIFSGIEEFRVRDELYIHDFRGNIDVHFYTEKNGEKVPVVWTKIYGKGRVCYIEPGHLAASIQNTGVKLLLDKALRWVTQ